MRGFGFGFGLMLALLGGNASPTVSITAPTAGADVYAGAPTTLSWTSSDSDGTVASVALYLGDPDAGGTLLHTGGASGSYTWNPTSAILGARNLYAVATDSGGATTKSAAHAVTVVDPSSIANLLTWHSSYSLTDVTLNTVDRTDLAGWTSAALTRTGGQADPFGGTAAHLLVEDGTSATHQITTATPTALTGDHEFDVYVKATGSGAKRWLALSVGVSTGALLVDPTDGTYQAGSNVAGASVVSAGNGWWRVRAVIQRTSGVDARIYIQNANQTSVNTYLGDSTSGLIFYAAFMGQRRVSQLNDKSGNNYHQTQGTDGSRPTLLANPTLGNRLTIGVHAALSKTLGDNAAVSAALSGSDTPFTLTCFTRFYANGVASDMVKATGSTSQHTILGTTAAYGFTLSRTPDTGSIVTPTFGPSDFTTDRNWHAISIVFTGTACELWIDGQKSPTTFALDVATATFTALTETFNRRLSTERTIHTRALNSTEIAQLHNGFFARAGLPLPSLENPLNIPGVQGWWEVDQGVTLAAVSLNPDLTTWSKTLVAITANGDGSYRFTDSATGDLSHFITSAGTGFVNASPVVLTVEMKKAPGGRTWAALQLGSGFAAYVNLDTGAVGTQVSCTCTSESLGDGWYRFRCSGTPTTVTFGLYSAEADNDVNYSTSGAPCFDARNVVGTQDRVSAWVDKTLAGWSFTQASGATQPFYFSGVYGAAGQINALPAIGNLDQYTESMTSTGFGAIWSGTDLPVSVVGLFNRINNPGGTVTSVLLAGLGSARHSLLRYTTGGYTTLRTDDAAASVTPTAYGAPSPGAQTISEVFTGTASSMFINGVQFGATKALDVGACTFDTTTALNFRVKTSRGFIVANRALTDAERIAQENGFLRRAGLI